LQTKRDCLIRGNQIIKNRGKGFKKKKGNISHNEEKAPHLGGREEASGREVQKNLGALNISTRGAPEKKSRKNGT